MQNLNHISYRPVTFKQVVGQEIVIKLIQNALKLKNLPKALVLYGESGIGKTTIARLIAANFVCENIQNNDVCGICKMCKSIQACSIPDIIEFDAASYTSVDDIRLILEQCNYLPQYAAKKIFIIDEAHMLSRNAIAALLKTFEEAPEHIMFILATTHIDKLSNAIRSRCLCLPLKEMTNNNIENHLFNLAKLENIIITEEAVSTIASLSQGSMRESISIYNRAKLLNQNIDIALLHQILFFAEKNDIEKICNLIYNNNSVELYEFLNYIFTNFNVSIYSILNQIIECFKKQYLFLNKEKILKILIDLNKLNSQIGKSNIYIEKFIINLVEISYNYNN